MTKTIAIARRELLDLRRNRLLVAVLGLVLLAVSVSVYIASLNFAGQLSAYNTYVSALKASGSTVVPAAPQLFPLQLLRGSIEYLEVLGALFAVIMGYGAVAKERSRGTLALVFSRSVDRWAFALGKTTAMATAWAIATLLVFGDVTSLVALIGHAPLHPIDFERLAIAALTAWIYLVFWSAFALGLAAYLRNASGAIIVSLALWLLVVLVIPQIGDTLDPDNQVPGGLFKSLQIAKPDEMRVLAHFSTFDTIRNALEVSSVTKHYERFTFAVLGIKDMYNQAPLATVWLAVWNNAVTLLAAAAASIGFAASGASRNRLLRRNS